MGRRPAVALACLAMLAIGKAAESADPPAGWQRLSLTWTQGFPFGGPGSSLESALVREGFHDTSPTTCVFPDAWCVTGGRPSPRTDHDWKRSPIPLWSIRARYQLKQPWAVGLAVSHAPSVQQTSGDRLSSSSDWDHVEIGSGVTGVDAVLCVGYEAARLALGPSLNVVRLKDQYMSEEVRRATVFGVTAEAGLQYPSRSRLFLEMVGRYRYLFPVRMRPPTLEQTSRLNFRYWDVSAGVGVRFRRSR